MSSRSILHRLILGPIVLCSTTLASMSHAQSNTALDRYEPTPAGDTWLAVPSSTADGELAPAGRVQIGYARAPLSLLVEQDGEEVGEVGDVVDHSVVLHLLTSVSIAHRLKLELDVPAVLSQGGDSPTSGGANTYVSPDGASLGDTRLGARAAVLEQDGWAPGAALGLSVWLPSGDDEAYTGTGEARFAPSLSLGGDYDFASYAVTVGRRFQGGRSAPGGLLDSEVYFGIAGGPRFGPFLVGVEIFGSTVADEGVDAFGERTTNAELLLSARYDMEPLAFHAAGGPGLASGVGTPRFRLIAGVGIARDLGELIRGRRDGRAGDGGDGQRASVPGGSTGPPPPDPQAGSVADRDRDGVADLDDRCPDVAGLASLDPEQDGCPAAAVAKPVEVEPDCAEGNTDPACQATARINADTIVISGEIRFATGSADLDPSSEPILAEVAKIMIGHPEIARLAVDGHTDDVGAEDKNVALSEQRALAVVRWLTAHGVDPRRTEARGFGPKQGIADNGTEEGRAKNRRVEFQILRRTDASEAGWSDGSLD